MSSGQSLILWENVKLLGYNDDLRAYAAHLRRVRKIRQAKNDQRKVGYTSTPKTSSALARIRDPLPRSVRRRQRRG